MTVYVLYGRSGEAHNLKLAAKINKLVDAIAGSLHAILGALQRHLQTKEETSTYDH